MSPLSRRKFIGTTLATSAALASQGADAKIHITDVFVYGSTPGGIASALEAARRGCRVTLACPKTKPGGMTSSGLCTTDAVRRELFGGLVEEFVLKVRARYQKTLGENHPDYALTRELLGGEVEVQHVQFFDVIPGVSMPTPPHQDAPFFSIDPSHALTFWIPLSEIKEEHGCLH